MIPRLTNPPLHASIAEIPEGELVHQLLGDRHWRASLFGIRGMPNNPRLLQRLPLEDAPAGFVGDADIVLCEPEHPSVATAIEVKRIKVGAAAFKTGRPNKLQEYEKAVEQANRLAQVGFAQVYLYIIVVVDSRANNDGWYTYDGLTADLRAKIEPTISLAHLDSRIGLVRHDFVQPMDHPPLELGTYGGQLIRLAREVPQSAGVTAWIAGLLGWSTA